MRILIAEDDRPTQRLLQMVLEKLGHEVTATDDGAAAFEAYRRERPDVLISDLMMPHVDGLELCRRLRAHEAASPTAGGYTYFVFLTTLNDAESLKAGLGAGADDYLKKPFKQLELEGRLMVARRVTALHKDLARLAEEARQEGRTDALTGVWNRRRMREDLAAMTARAVRYGHHFAVALVDVDHFKRYNDSRGHLAGDEALARVAQVLRAEGRSGDSVYRYGGEEFLVLLPEQSLREAEIAMERRCASVRELAIPHPASLGSSVLTVSVGLAEHDPAEGGAFEALIERADRALYRAKTQGRDRLALAAPLESPPGPRLARLA